MNRPDAKATPERHGRVGHQSVDGTASLPDEEIRLVDLWRIVWDGRWIVVAITGLFALAAATYAFLATEIYRSEVLLAPAEEKIAQGLAGQFGGLASLAGISVGGGSTTEPIAVLKSRGFIREFIEENQLIPVFFADDWDARAGRWRVADREDWPDWRDAVKYFMDNVYAVSEDRKTGLVTVSIEWTDPQVAADWANELVQRLNDKMREKALVEAQASVEYLRAEITSTGVVTLQQSIGRLLETELQKLMLAKGREEFAFKVVDRAEPPKFLAKPVRTLVVVLGVLLGGIVSTVFVILRHATRISTRLD